MSWTVSKNWDYATTGGASLPLPKIDFSGNYVEKSGEKDGMTFADMSAPLDRPALTHIEWHQKTNAYQNTGIDRAFWAPSVRGFNVHLQSMCTYDAKDSESNTEFYIPFKANTTIQSLAHECVTADLVQDFLAYHVAQFFKQGVITTDRVAAFMRGSLDLTK